MIAIHLAFYARLTLWNGDWAWGPRYLLLILPFALLPAAGALAWVRGRWAWRVVVGAVAALGVAVQLLGVLVNFGWDRTRIYDAPTTDAERAARVSARYFSPPDSPLVVHAGYLTRHLAEWRARAWPPPNTAVLGGGFAAPEADPARATFPRWTTGAGEVALYTAAPADLLVKLTFFDHRPPALRAAQPTVLVDGAALPEGAVERRDFSGDGSGWNYQFTVPARAVRGGGATVTLVSPPWNPQAAGVGDRDETLGVYVNNVEVWRAGRPWRVRDGAALVASRAFGAVPDDPAALYAWFNDERAFGGADYADPAHQFIDWWPWYAAVAGLARGTATRWIAAYGVVAALPLLAGVILFARTLPPRRRRRGRQGRKARRA